MALAASPAYVPKLALQAAAGSNLRRLMVRGSPRRTIAASGVPSRPHAFAIAGLGMIGARLCRGQRCGRYRSCKPRSERGRIRMPAMRETAPATATAEDAARARRLRKPSAFRDYINKRMRGLVPADEISGVSTGWSAVDEFYKPVRGELTVLTGTPGSGKSEWLLALAMNIALRYEWKFGLCTMETQHDDLIVQLMEKAKKVRFDSIHPVQRKICYEDVIRKNFKILESTFMEPTLASLQERARYAADVEGIDGLIIDPFNYIAPPEDRSISQTQFVSKLMTTFKRIAVENNIHVWLVAHPTKASAWRSDTLTLYDCSGSAHFYNKCDMGLIIARNKIAPGVRVKVDKVRNRDAGKVGSVNLSFHRGSRCYSDKPEMDGLSALPGSQYYQAW